jgi:hypothetical protein
MKTILACVALLLLPTLVMAASPVPAHLEKASVKFNGGEFQDTTYAELQYRGAPGQRVCVSFAMGTSTDGFQTELLPPRDQNGRYYASTPSRGCVTLDDSGRGLFRQGVTDNRGVLIATMQLSPTVFHTDTMDLGTQTVLPSTDAGCGF